MKKILISVIALLRRPLNSMNKAASVRPARLRLTAGSRLNNSLFGLAIDPATRESDRVTVAGKPALIRNFLIAGSIAALGGAVAPIYADDTHHPKAAEQKSYAAKGEVLAVDKASGRVRLKHEAIPALGWPAMTMPFPVADKSQLDGVEVGDQVEFQFVRTNGGAPMITQIKSVK